MSPHREHARHVKYQVKGAQLTEAVGKFEVNPNGQWHWLAVRAHVPLVEAMADALQGDETA